MPNKQVLKGLGVQLIIALPIVVMNTFDWWVYDIMIFMAGMYGVKQQAAQIVMMNLMSVIYQFSLGFGLSATTIIGGIIGEGDIKKAKVTYRIV
jgi:Na+-driven multidrug efflux pump